MKLCAKVAQPVRVVLISSRVQTDAHDQIKAAAVARWGSARGRISDDWNTWRSSVLTHPTPSMPELFRVFCVSQKIVQSSGTHTPTKLNPGQKPPRRRLLPRQLYYPPHDLPPSPLPVWPKRQTLILFACSLAPSPPSQWIKAFLRVSPWQPLCKWWSVLYVVSFEYSREAHRWDWESRKRERYRQCRPEWLEWALGKMQWGSEKRFILKCEYLLWLWKHLYSI